MSITAGEIISESSTLLGDPNNSYHTAANMLVYLNRALKDVCNRSKCIRETQTIAVVADQYQYGLPEMFLQADLVAFNDGRWWPLAPATLSGIINDRYGSGTSDSRPDWFDVWGNSRLQRVNGTAEAGGSNTRLIDSTKTFTSGANQVFIGDLVLNTTDNSEATVTAVTGAETIDFSGGLGGGVDNLMSTGDLYEIYSAHAPSKTLVLHPAPSASDTTGTKSIAVYMARKHLVVSQAMVTGNYDWLELDEELEDALLHRIMYWARSEEFGEESQQSKIQLTMYLTELRAGTRLINRRLRQFKSTWLRSLGSRSFDVTGTSRTTNPINAVVIG